MRTPLLLFFATCLTSVAAGLYSTGANPFEPATYGVAEWGLAFLYAIALLLILGAHEGGHYFTAQRRNVEVSPPYFLPALGPIPGLGVVPFFGTFGAFIKMELRELKAQDLAAIAAWGPIAGFVVTVVAIFAGVALSEPIVFEPSEGLLLGDPLLLAFATELFHPDMTAEMELMLHPLALAGWVGALLTALNLLPLGQLDGGHLAYALLGERARWISYCGLLVLLILGIFFFPGWLILVAFLFWMGLRHPPILEGNPGGRATGIYAGLCLVIFVLTFTPAPVIVDGLLVLLNLDYS